MHYVMQGFFQRHRSQRLSLPALVANLTTIILLAGTPAILLAGTPAHASDCSGKPDVLGTSRTLVVDPTEHLRIGTMQYPETLPLKDHEVVLTFDDGPIPAHTNPILDVLASQCVKATFFIVGQMARNFPATVRRVRDLGHTIGTHSQTHPYHFGNMPPERMKAEIEDGIKNTAEALNDPAAMAPFFRFPGLGRTEAMESYLASRGIMTWSADFPADDWLHISSKQVISTALSRLEARGKGVLLLHDIQPRTQAALPTLLHELKVRGYRIVHVVAATPERPKTPTKSQAWLKQRSPEVIPVARWPKIPNFIFAATETMPVPAMRESETIMVEGQSRDTLPRKRILWPSPMTLSVNTASSLPAPDMDLFHIQEEAKLPSKGLTLRTARSRKNSLHSQPQTADPSPGLFSAFGQF